jgi:hypothetical protein
MVPLDARLPWRGAACESVVVDSSSVRPQDKWQSYLGCAGGDAVDKLLQVSKAPRGDGRPLCRDLFLDEEWRSLLPYHAGWGETESSG